MIEAAIASLGICQMPVSLVRRHLESGALQSVLDAHMQRHIDIHALWPPTRHLRPKVRYVVDELTRLAGEGCSIEQAGIEFVVPACILSPV